MPHSAHVYLDMCAVQNISMVVFISMKTTFTMGDPRRFASISESPPPPPSLLLGQWRKKCHQSARNNPSASVSTDLSRTAHCHSLWGQSVPGSYGRIRRNPRYYHERTLNLADIIASGDIDRSVVPPPSSSHPLGAACVCSQWHLITELTKARGGPSGVNEIVTGHRRGTSVRDNAERGAIQRTLPAAALGFIQPFFFFFSSSTGSSAAVFISVPSFPFRSTLLRPTRSQPVLCWRCPKKDLPSRSPG